MNTDYYALLEAWPTSSKDDIKKNYFRLAKLYHPDVAGDKPEVRERFKQINEAFSTLDDPEKRHQYNESLRKSKQGSRDAQSLQENDQRTAILAFQQAKEAMRDGFYDKAVLLLKSAIKYNSSNPTYQSWYGFCLAMTNKNLHEARDACRMAIQSEFYNADYHANLGFVYFKAGLKAQSIKHFREALKWDSKNSIANKFLDRVDRGRGKPVGPIDRMISAAKHIFTSKSS
ncbi:MAG: DnaJ domain-containing protein [Candidatus Krumholzibacteria bacterium]|nr:DnaJ domain-containing protein [Candidatus Krumholzibacteria bacterium]